MLHFFVLAIVQQEVIQLRNKYVNYYDSEEDYYMAHIPNAIHIFSALVLLYSRCPLIVSFCGFCQILSKTENFGKSKFW